MKGKWLKKRKLQLKRKNKQEVSIMRLKFGDYEDEDDDYYPDDEDYD